MKKILSVLLCTAALLSLTACGAASSGTPDKADAPASALEMLETVWNAYTDDEKFPAAGGDSSEENMRTDAPGTFSVADADTLDFSLGFPAADADKIDDAASLTHMLNGNTFTCGAYHAKNAADVPALCTALRENILARRWMCGFPDKLVVVSAGEYVAAYFGLSDMVDTFTAKLTAAYPNARVVSDDPIE